MRDNNNKINNVQIAQKFMLFYINPCNYAISGVKFR